MKALRPFIKQAAKKGVALDSLILAKNNVIDERLVEILEPFEMYCDRMRGLVIADNTIGDLST